MEGVPRTSTQKGAYDFENHYNHLCAVNYSYPLSAVKAHLPQGILDLNADRIRINDWKPILNTLSINKSLEFIVFTSSYVAPAADEKKKKDRFGCVKVKPCVASKEIKDELCKGLGRCLSVTPALACLRLQGINFRESSLTYLAKGLSKNSSLNYFCLAHCKIGDNGLQCLAHAIKNNMSLNAINLVGCNLTWKGADIIAKLIKHQCMVRHNEAWKNSLRYRQPDLECMSGLRRITLNENPMISDHGAMLLAEALRDDLWLKALDMQQCGLSKYGGKVMRKMLQYNTTLVVLDVRDNPLIEPSVIQDIIDQVHLNCKANTEDISEPEYEWISLKAECKFRKKKKRVRKGLNVPYGRKTHIKINGMSYQLDNAAAWRQQASSSSSRPQPCVQPKQGRGIPWRTELRAHKQKGFFSNHEEQYDSEGNMEILVDCGPDNGMAWSKPVHEEPHPEEKPVNNQHSHHHTTNNNDTSNPYQPHIITSSIEGEYKKLEEELNQVKKNLADEQMARVESDKKLYKLSYDNNDLQSEVLSLKKKLSLLEEEDILDSIENAFMQFHVFLDILRDAGFGQLISLAGIDNNFFSLSKMVSGRGKHASSKESNPNMDSFPPNPESSPNPERAKAAAQSHVYGDTWEQRLNLRINSLRDNQPVIQNRMVDLNSTYQVHPAAEDNSMDPRPTNQPKDGYSSQCSPSVRKPQMGSKESQIKQAMLRNMSPALVNSPLISETQASPCQKSSHEPYLSSVGNPVKSKVEGSLREKMKFLKRTKTCDKDKSGVKALKAGFIHGGHAIRDTMSDCYNDCHTANCALSGCSCTSNHVTSQRGMIHSNCGASAPNYGQVNRANPTRHDGHDDEVDGDIYQTRQDGDIKVRNLAGDVSPLPQGKDLEIYSEEDEDQDVHYSLSEPSLITHRGKSHSDHSSYLQQANKNCSNMASPKNMRSPKLKLLESLIEDESDSSVKDSCDGYSLDSFEDPSSRNQCSPAPNHYLRSKKSPIPHLAGTDSNPTSPLRSISDETF
ncbi:hypothetical protein Ahia01_000865100 [Argonauta hians]